MKTKKGISLIVLVITIIVMLVLASAVIITLSNTNIITKAKEAVNKTNDKTLQQQADLYEAELKLEFRELSLGNVMLPQYAKDAYKEAIKEGKTEEEARQTAKDTFIGGYYDWMIYNDQIIPIFDSEYGTVNYTPMYLECKRVVELLKDGKTGVDKLDVDTSIVPEDLVANLEAYNEKWKEYAAGAVTTTEVNAYYKTLDPLYGFMKMEPENKYFYDVAQVTLPYYIYDSWKKTNIYKFKDYEFYDLGVSDVLDVYDITVLTLDDNYTTLDAWKNDINIFGDLNENCKIVLPNTLKRINARGLNGLGVISLEIPSSVEYIDEEAFGNPDEHALEELIIKKEKGSIKGEPWGLDTTVTTITWDPE